MGNTPSSEDPRRPQKLSKLQLGSDAPGTGPHHALNQLETHHGRSSNSYLVGSGPGSSPNSSPIEPSHPGIGIAISVDDFEHGKPPLPRRNSRRDSRLWSIVSRNHSFKPDHTRSRSMTAPTTRPRSFVSDGDALPLAQGENLRTIRHCSSANLNVRTREAQQLQTLDREGVDESSLSTPENQSPTCDVTENTWKSSHPTYNARSIPRSNSDASIYMPMRRRSLVQTPGVATRAYPSTSTASGRSNFPNSLSTPSQTRHSSIESSAVPSLSIPPVKFGSHTPERVVTPCEAEYKQLGGMKFGSLRIMNGAPKLSPRIEKDNNMDGGFAPTTATSADQESRSSPRLKGSDERNGSFTENGTGIEYAVPEILYVRDDPNAKPTAETIRLELESKTLKNLNRSDSGFISSPSSEGSRKAVSKTDSGYSSNVSLRSLQSLRSAATDASRKSPEKEAKSITQAATTLLISGKSPVTKMSKSTDAGSPRRKAEVADQTVLHNGKEPRVTSQTEREPINKAKPELPKTPDHHSVAARRNSLPALSGSRSSLPETNSAPYRVKKTRTPPPVSMQTRSGKKSRGQGLSHSQSAPSPAELAHLRQPSVPREARRDMIQSYPQAQGAPEFYGNPSYNQVVSLNQQQLAYLHRHRTASWHTGSGSQSPLSVAQPGHQRRSSAPSPQGHHGHSRVRSRSGSALSQQQLGRLSPQVQPMYGGSHMGQQWLHPHPMQFNGQVHGMDAMMYQELDRHVALTPQPVHSRHRRAVSQGATYSQNPPFRVLHSYNSPAYKGAPIWG
ncbi:hypothetical protein EDB81DRAFT_10086 [Dactylonectria macrodidyma]|uniref:Uncharacterized protein n=1 Tax=Dactylonectria macrodidyma TaxID=307937 RepID=A0A9P9JMD1_9HYPO|nr:hypothetical protein EDB81DRAFT_10086 [Dactylonectria macrodidyma]